ncbi:BadF/BadG/BcrA/BcrD ATPase family protein [Streptomyces sp. NPDC005805]|uniref:N-acetylglucosamine kinase n=1 Tax=Streptomyces sp. NPDC005805 TaxID=3157068 RepID=UPI0033DD8CFF
MVLGVDSGGSGLRVALAPVGALEAAVTASGRQPVRTGPGGIDAAHLRELLLPLVRGLPGPWGGEVRPAAVVIGAAGLATLGDRLRAELPGALEAELGVRRLGLAADAVTAYAGALGQDPGVVVAAGTGMIALGTDLRTWRRADGWGHLLGDCGGGAWIGRAGLEAALRAHDGRSGGSRALLERMEAVFGPAASLPGLLYPRSDRPAVLASFAPEVARCAAAGDAVAAGIMARAATEIADTAAAAVPVRAGGPAHGGPGGGGPRVAVTGGLTRTGEALTGPLRAALAERLPGARLVPAAGDPLAGALLLAEALATDSLRLPPHPSMLHLYDGTGR